MVLCTSLILTTFFLNAQFPYASEPTEGDNQTKTWLLRCMIYTGVFFVGLLGIASQGRNFIDDSSRLDL